MHTFWSSVFILPSRVLLDIEQIMRGFLWCQGSMRKGRAKVAWEAKLLSLKESLWVNWVHEYKLNGRSFWDIPSRGNMSWGWHKILQLCTCIRDLIWHKISDGSKTFLWFDRWCDVSPLADSISSRDMFPEGFNLSTKVCDAIVNEEWKWSQELLVKYPWLSIIVVPNLLDGPQDRLIWHDINGNQIPFKDANLGNVCSLCETQPDSLEHLFFECPFSQVVWSHMKVYAGLDASAHDLYLIISNFLPLAKRKTSRSVIAKLVVSASAYFLWQERNGRLFKKHKRYSTQIIECITTAVRLKLLSCRFKKSKDGVRFAQIWDLPDTIFV
ncbi:hypothetical protein Tco_0096728 [Tanacetum coccineum]